MTVVESLPAELAGRRSELRPPEVVMAPALLGAARLTRYSFSRTMLRRAATDGWTARRVRLELDGDGRGEAVYELDTGLGRFSFVAFTTTIDESRHTDRVIADAWEISAALVEGDLTADLMERLRTQVPLQEAGRLDPRVLVLTRGNRSVRFFEYLVETLAAGSQPDPDLVADAGYIMRSTAFYANGKYGMRSFDGYPDGHPLGVPYRAQFVCAWLFRELAYDVVESCAMARGGSGATGFDDEWRRYFGLGNATGLGLVPFAFRHPRMINAWAGVRELALADVRSCAGDPAASERLDWWIERAHRHFSDGTDDDCRPFLSAAELVPVVATIRDAFARCGAEARPFDALYRWAEQQGPETAELVVSLLLELHDGDDIKIDARLSVVEHASADPAMTVGEARGLLESRFKWLDDLDLADSEADAFWWVISDNTDEPRRARRARLQPRERDVTVDVALRLARLRTALETSDDGIPLGRLVADHPEHRYAVERLHASDRLYGEPRDNACASGYLPLQLQRFQLAMYGMDNFKPKSTDWLRVTLFQGAPRLSDLGPDLTDDWVLPPRPGGER